MKKFFCFSSIAAVAVALCLSFGAAPRVHRGGSRPPIIWVVAQNAPGNVQVGGPYVYKCDFSDDQVEIQMAIDEAERWVRPVPVHLSAGSFRISAPIRIGISSVATGVHTTVLRAKPCSLIADGYTTIQWTAGDQASPATFMMYICTLDGTYVDFEVGGFEMFGSDNVSGIYAHRISRGTLRDIYIKDCKFFGLVVNNAWFSRIDNIVVEGSEGMDYVFLRNNGGILRGSRSHSNDGTNIPNVQMYECKTWLDANDDPEAWSDTFWPLEVITSDAGGDDGVFLGWASHPYATSIVVAHEDAGDEFAEDETLTGESSDHSADGDDDTADLRSCVYTEGTAATIRDFDYEQHTYGNTYPLMLVHGPSTVVDKVRYEATSSAKMADVLITVEDASSVSIKNLECISATHTNGALMYANCNAVDVGNQFTGLSAAFVLTIDFGDEIYAWDPAGGMTPGVFTVKAEPDGKPTATSLEVEEDVDANETGTVNVLSIPRRTAEYPATAVNLEGADNAVVENVWALRFAGGIVVIDSDSDGVICTNVRTWIGAGIAQPDYWLTAPRPTALIANAGTQTTVIGSQIFDGTAGTVGMTGAMDTYGVDQTFDGPEIASANALAIGPTWSPQNRIYVTGAVAITSVTGGYQGQSITLISRDGGLVITDGANLNVGGGNVTLGAYETIRLVCTVTTGDAWQVMAFESYP